MTTQKIKSITVKLPIDTISFNHLEISNIESLNQDQLYALKTLAKYDGNIEYEKPTILKRPDGSVISGLEAVGKNGKLSTAKMED
jgi:hypothetical protein